MKVFLLNGDARDATLRAALTANGITPDEERSAFGSPEVCGWGIQDAPCLAEIHDGCAVYQVTDQAAAKVATWDADAAAAVTAYDEAKAAQQAQQA